MIKKSSTKKRFVNMDGNHPVKVLTASQRETAKALAEAGGAWVFTNLPLRHCGCPGHRS